MASHPLNVMHKHTHTHTCAHTADTVLKHTFWQCNNSAPTIAFWVTAAELTGVPLMCLETSSFLLPLKYNVTRKPD